MFFSMSAWRFSVVSGLVMVLGLTWPTLSEATQTRPRVVTLTPHATELVYAAGAGDLIVATIDASDYPPAARDLPRLGDGLHNSLEAILRWQPDIVIGWPSVFMSQLHDLGVQVLTTAPRSIDEITQDIERIGSALGTADMAGAAAADLRAKLQTLQAAGVDNVANHGQHRVRVVVLASANGSFVMGADPLMNEAIIRCGGTNPFNQSRLHAQPASLEGIISAKPELIVSGGSVPKALQDIAPIGVIDPDWLYRPGPRFSMATFKLCELIKGITQRGRRAE